MKILIYGSGVIGSIFGAKLSLSGQNVTMLARGDRFLEIKDKGLILRDPNTGREEKANVKVIEKLLPGMKFDYILVVMQRTQIGAVLENLSQNCSENIVFVVNTSAGYEEWIRAIGADRLMIGFPSAGGERVNGVVNFFVGKGLMRCFQTTTFGEVSPRYTQRVKHIIRAFNRAGIPSTRCADMDAWQKTHVAVVTSIANALYGHNCDNKKLAASYKDIKSMVVGIKEGFCVLRQLKIRPTPQKLRLLFNMPAGLTAAAFKLFMKTELAEITMAKHCIAAKQEMICLQKEFDILIEKSGISTPCIDRLRQNLYHAR